jgi:hypothetical protein
VEVKFHAFWHEMEVSLTIWPLSPHTHGIGGWISPIVGMMVKRKSLWYKFDRKSGRILNDSGQSGDDEINYNVPTGI